MRKRTIANLRKNGFFYCVAAREVDRVIFDSDGHWNSLEVARTVKLAYGDLIEGLSAMSDRKVANAILRTMGEVPVQNPCAGQTPGASRSQPLGEVADQLLGRRACLGPSRAARRPCSPNSASWARRTCSR